MRRRLLGMFAATPIASGLSGCIGPGQANLKQTTADTLALQSWFDAKRRQVRQKNQALEPSSPRKRGSMFRGTPNGFPLSRE